jgi:hypothetical protein
LSHDEVFVFCGPLPQTFGDQFSPFLFRLDVKWVGFWVDAVWYWCMSFVFDVVL